MDFDNIIGQEEVIKSLKNSIAQNKVGHAYIFSGPKGIGKRTIAEIFAGLLLCQNPGNFKRCGECQPCRMLDEGINPDFHVVEPINSSILIEETRKIQSEIIVKPLYSYRKVYVIIDADKMTSQAQNSLLKTLEEPPDYAVLILTTTIDNAIIETIRSRAVKINFKKNTYEQVLNYLKSKARKKEGMEFIASYSDGVIGAALELADSEGFISLRNKAIEVISKIVNSKFNDVFDDYGFLEKNKDDIDTILDIMLLFYRDILLAKQGGAEKLLINSDKKDIIFNNASIMPLQKIIKSMDTLEETRRQLLRNANYQLSMEVMLMKLQEECG